MQQPARFGWLDAAGRPQEEAGPQVGFQPGHLLADDGLADAETFGGACERARVDDGHEISEPIEIDRLQVGHPLL